MPVQILRAAADVMDLDKLVGSRGARDLELADDEGGGDGGRQERRGIGRRGGERGGEGGHLGGDQGHQAQDRSQHEERASLQREAGYVHDLLLLCQTVP